MSAKNIESALQKLINDEAYRSRIAEKPNQLQVDFDLTNEEMAILRDVAEKGGWAPQSVAAAYCCCSCCCAN